MFLANSRYEKARPFTAQEGGNVPFAGVRPREIPVTPGVIEHIVQAGERLDLLARHYYNDDRLWWRIVDANTEIFSGGDLVRENEVRDADAPAADPPRLESMVGRSIVIPRARG